MPQRFQDRALPTLPDDAGLREWASEDPEGLYEIAV